MGTESTQVYMWLLSENQLLIDDVQRGLLLSLLLFLFLFL